MLFAWLGPTPFSHHALVNVNALLNGWYTCMYARSGTNLLGLSSNLYWKSLCLHHASFCATILRATHNWVTVIVYILIHVALPLNVILAEIGTLHGYQICSWAFCARHQYNHQTPVCRVMCTNVQFPFLSVVKNQPGKLEVMRKSMTNSLNSNTTFTHWDGDFTTDGKVQW